MSLDNRQLRLAKNDPKTFLSQNKLIDIQIDSLLMRITHFKNYSKYASISEYIKELSLEISKLKKLKLEIYNLLYDSVENDELCKLLDLRFLQGFTIDEASEKLYFSRRWLLRLQNKALKLFSDTIAM